MFCPTAQNSRIYLRHRSERERWILTEKNGNNNDFQISFWNCCWLFPVDWLSSVYLWPLIICHIYKLVQPKKRCYQFCLNHFQKTGNKNPPRRQKPWMFWNIFFMFQLYISFSISCCDINVRMCLCSGRVQDRNILLRVQKNGFSCPDSVRLIPPITKSFHLRVVCDPESKVINDVRRLTYVKLRDLHQVSYSSVCCHVFYTITSGPSEFSPDWT